MYYFFFFTYNIYKNYKIKEVIVYFLIQKIMLGWGGGGGLELKTAWYMEIREIMFTDNCHKKVSFTPSHLIQIIS